MSASLWHVVLLAVYGLSSVTSSPIEGDEKSEEKRSGQCITELYKNRGVLRMGEIQHHVFELLLGFLFVCLF